MIDTTINVLLVSNGRQFAFKRYCDKHLPIKKAEFEEKGLQTLASGRMEIEAGQAWAESMAIQYKDMGLVYDEKATLLTE